jgi:TolB-like protein
MAQDGRGIAYVETIPKRGYRLASPVVSKPMGKAGSSRAISVAIPPLSNHSQDSQVEYLCEGIAEEILYRLSKVRGLKVFSALSLKEERLDPRVIGLRFSADNVLVGSLQKSGQKIRLSVRLDDVGSGETIWTDRYDQEMSEVFELQDTVARQVVRAMSPVLTVTEEESPVLEHSGTLSVEAFNAFLLGKHSVSKTTSQSYDDAIAYFQQAVTIDPTFARAHYRLFLANYMKRRELGADDSFLENARVAAANAKKFGYKPAVPWIHIQRRLNRELQPDIRELEWEALGKIRQQDPEWGSFSYEQLTWVLPAAGFFKATLAFAERMLDSPSHNYQDSDADEELHSYYAAAGQLEDAIRQISGIIQKDPARPFFHMERSILYSRTGQFEYAQQDIDILQKGRYFLTARAFYYYWQKQTDRVLEIRDQLLAIDNVHPNHLLYVNCLVGDFDSALGYYAEAVNSESRAYVDFGPLRAITRAKLTSGMIEQLERHEGFTQLLRSQGVDEAWRMELAERVNELTPITGIAINPDDP